MDLCIACRERRPRQWGLCKTCLRDPHSMRRTDHLMVPDLQPALERRWSWIITKGRVLAR